MRFRPSVWLLAGGGLLVAAGAWRGAEAAGEVIEVIPRPIGAAAQIVSSRGAGEEVQLPVSGLVEAPEGAAEVKTRSSYDLSRPFTTARLSSLAYEGVYYPTPSPEPAPTVQPAPAEKPTEKKSKTNDAKAKERAASQKRVYELLKDNVEELKAVREKQLKKEKEREAAQRTVKGPSALAAINLLEGLRVDPGLDLEQSNVLAIDHHVYQDGNPDSGLFYFIPKRYDLDWSPETQYSMKVIYGMAGQSAEEGEVYMAARLRAGVDGHELEIARTLLRAYLRRHSNETVMKYRELRPLQLKATSAVNLFGGASNEFAVPASKISVQGITGLLDALDVSWATDVRRLLNVESLLQTDAGIHGTITFHAAGEGDFHRAIPLEIAVAAPDTFRRIPFDRANGWTNRTFYPIRLARLHALLLSPDDNGLVRKDEPIVLSWDLGGTRVEPGVTVRWNSLLVPPWVDEKALLAWASYSVENKCEPCDQRVFDEKFIPAPPATRAVVFTTGDAFESTGAYRIEVKLRSPFLTPQRDHVVEQPSVTLTGDGKEFPVARLFLTDREFSGAGAEQPFYEYALEVTMKDGTVHRSPNWVPSRDFDHLLGSASITQVLGFLPKAGSTGGTP